MNEYDIFDKAHYIFNGDIGLNIKYDIVGRDNYEPWPWIIKRTWKILKIYIFNLWKKNIFDQICKYILKV